jgi:hypothetical protein
VLLLDGSATLYGSKAWFVVVRDCLMGDHK